jgi:hypothetical protein
MRCGACWPLRVVTTFTILTSFDLTQSVIDLVLWVYIYDHLALNYRVT